MWSMYTRLKWIIRVLPDPDAWISRLAGPSWEMRLLDISQAPTRDTIYRLDDGSIRGKRGNHVWAPGRGSQIEEKL